MDIVRNAILKQGAAWKGGPRVIGGPEGLLARLVPFQGQSAMWARRYDGTRSVDCLGNYPGDYESFMSRQYYLDDPKLDLYDTWGPLYVVYSYNTPIAWVKYDGTVVIPDLRYSVTTAHHQNVCRAWLGKAPCDHFGKTWAECAAWQHATREWGKTVV